MRAPDTTPNAPAAAPACPDPIAALRRAVALLDAASPDWYHTGPTDGGEPLHWPAALKAARAHIEHALRLLEKPDATLARETASADAELGMIWWNTLTRAERDEWMRRAGNTGVAADAWEAFKAQR